MTDEGFIRVAILVLAIVFVLGGAAIEWFLEGLTASWMVETLEASVLVFLLGAGGFRRDETREEMRDRYPGTGRAIGDLIDREHSTALALSCLAISTSLALGHYEATHLLGVFYTIAGVLIFFGQPELFREGGPGLERLEWLILGTYAPIFFGDKLFALLSVGGAHL